MKVHVRVVRCQSKKRIIRRVLDRRTCRYIYTVRWYTPKNCSCRPKYQRLTQVACCKRKPKVNRYCVNNRRVVKVTRWVRVPIVGRRRSPRIAIYRCVPRISSRSYFVGCRRPKVSRHCNRRTGVFTVVRIVPVKRNCKCSYKRLVRRGRCWCKRPVHKWGKCKGGYRRWTIFYRVLVKHRCIQRRRSRRCACSCPRNRRTRKCLIRTGAIYIVTVRYVLRRNRCPRKCIRLEKRRIVPLRCRVRRYTSPGKCVRKTCRQKVRLTLLGYNRRQCKCRKAVRYYVRTCCCPGKKVSPKRCVSNRILRWTVTRFRLVRWKCYPVIAHKRKLIYCGRRTRRVSNCKANGYKYTTFYYRVSKNCKCVVIKETRKRICNCNRIKKYKRTVTKRCTRNGRSWRIVVTYYVLIRGRCHRRRYTRHVHVRCHGVRRRKLCNKKSCVLTRLVYVRRPRHCKCQWRLHSRNNRFRCCCPGKRYVRTNCVNNRIKRLWFIRYQLSRGVCRVIRYRKDRPIRCSRKVYRLKVCNKGRCNGTLLTRVFRPHNCKCRLVTVRRRSIKCCCRKSHKTRNCVNQRYWVTKVWTYRLVRYRCVVRLVGSRRRVVCGVTRCRVSYTKCIRNFQYRIVRCLRARNCRCLPVVISRKRRRCSCNKKARTVKSNCNRRSCFRNYVIQIYSFRKTTRKCYWRNARRWRVRCCCHKNTKKRTVCIGNVIERTWYSVVVFDRRRKVCRVIVERRNKRIRGCSTRPRLVGVRKLRCNRNNGYRYYSRRYVVARNCKCKYFNRKIRVPCICSRIHPSKTWKRCIRNVWVTYRSRWVLRGRRCVKLVRKSGVITSCPRGYRRVIKKCRPSAWWTPVTFLKSVPRNCRCRWVVFRRLRKPCRCRRKRPIPRCIRNIWYIRRFYSYIRGYRCYYRVIVKRRLVPCKVGTTVRRSKCNRKNRYVITRTTKYRLNCKCRRRIRRRFCHCKCPKTNVTKRCLNYRIYYRRSYFIRLRCRCVRRIRTWTRYPKCPRIKYRVVTRCVRRGVIGTRFIILKRHVRNRRNCTCTVKTRKYSQVCWCKPDKKKTKVCRKNRYYITHYRRVLSRRRCSFRPYYRRIITIRCPRRRKLVSPCSKLTRRRTITYIWHVLSKCKCIRRTRKTSYICRCLPGRKYTVVGKCNRKTCRKHSRYYVLVLVNRRCIKRFRSYTKVCCCFKLKPIRRCQPRYSRFINVKRWYRFYRGRCLYRQRIRYTYVRCPRKLHVTKQCLKGCRLVITVRALYSRNCKCIWRVVRRKIRKCCCPKKRVVVICQPQHRRRLVRVYSYRLKNGRCYRLFAYKYVRINCPKRTRRIICDKKTGVRTVIRTWHSVSRNCLCRKHVVTRRSRCECKPNVKRNGRCNRARGIIFKYTYVTVLRNFRCVRIRRTVSKRVVCSRRKWITRSKCRNGKYIGKQFVYRNYYRRVACNCLRARRARLCNCNCRKPRDSKRCLNNYVLVYVRHRLYRWGCRCRIIRRFSRKGIRCPRSRVIASKCNRRTRRKIFHYISYVKRNCKCKRVVRVVSRICVCKKRTHKTHCNRNTNTIVHVYTWYYFRNWRCYLRRRVRKRRVFCRYRRLIAGKCNKRTRLRKYVRISKYARDCKCKVARTTFFRICICRPGFKKLGKCNRQRCLQAEYTFGRRLVRNKCLVYKKRTRLLRCCCRGKPFKYYQCIRNRKYFVSGYYKFIKRGRVCRIVRTSRRVYIPCPRKRLVYKRCLPNGVLVRKFVRGHVARCRCHRHYYYVNRRCRCPKPIPSNYCRRNVYRIFITRYQVLKRGVCIKKRTRKVVRIRCRRNILRITRCKKVGCQQAVIRILFRAINCVCRSRKIVRYRTCCCTKKKAHWSRCAVRTGIRYYYTRYYVFDAPRFRCLVKTYTRIKRTSCNKKNNVRYGRCKWPRGVYRIQFVYTRIHYRVACHCTSRVRRSYRLCDCGRSKRQVRCDKRRGLYITYEYGANLRVVNRVRRCIRYRRIVNRRRVVCPKVSPGLTPCNRRNCRRYRVFVTFTRRACKCVRRIRRLRLRCCCKNRRPRRTCVLNRLVTVTYSSRLLCRGYACVCSRRINTTIRPVSCPKPQVRVIRNCKTGRGRKIIHYSYSILRKCRCLRRTRRRTFKCTRRCVNYSRSCRTLERQGFCETSALVRNRLCKKSCGSCGCRKRMSYCRKPSRSMRTGGIYGGIFEIGRPRVPQNYRNGKRYCQKYCSKNSRCQAYQLRISAKKRRWTCILNSVNPKQLRIRTNGRHGAVNTPRSAIYVKYCHRQCRKARIIRVTKCKCRQLLGGRKYCWKSATIVLYRHKVCSGCRRIQVRKTIACNKRCPIGTWRYRTPCNQNTRKYMVYRVRYYKSEGICYTERKIRFEKCPIHEICKPRTITFPKPCIRGRRVVLIYIVRKVGKVCRRVYRKRVTNCGGCCPSVQVIPGPCRRNRRLVTRIWWDNIRGCCRRVVTRSSQLCRGCRSKVQRTYGACRLHYRVRYLTYWVRSNRKCRRRLVAKLVRC